MTRKYPTYEEEARMKSASSDINVDFAALSDGELQQLMLPTQSMSRLLLVVWLYLQHRVTISIGEFDQLLSSLAEAELRRRAASGNVPAQTLLDQGTRAVKIFQKLHTKRDLHKTETNVLCTSG